LDILLAKSAVNGRFYLDNNFMLSLFNNLIQVTRFNNYSFYRGSLRAPRL